MGNELAVIKQQTQPAVVEFNDVQTKLLKETVAQGCDDNEFLLFLEMARAKRLNPFDGQIRPVKRWDSTLKRNKMTVQVGIDGYRVIATRTGELAGIDDAIFDSEDAEHPKWAKTTVYRYGKNGDRNPFTATARYAEYVQRKKPENPGDLGDPNSMWARMPYLMTAKVSEALALRKAFPDELSGVYTNEEMGQADNNQVQQERPAKAPVAMPQAKAETKQLADGLIQIDDAVISARKSDKEDRLWLTTSQGVVVVSTNKAAKYAFNVGDSVSFKATEKQGKEIKFYMLQEVTFYAVNVEDPLPPMDGPLPEKKPVIEDAEFVDDSPTKKVGVSRQKRLYTLMTLNKSKTGLDKEIVHKLLDTIYSPPVPHLSDLFMDQHQFWERLMQGEEDWKPLLED